MAEQNGSALARQKNPRSYRRGCANTPNKRFTEAQDATLKRFAVAQWMTLNVKDKQPGFTYVGLDVLDPTLWNLERDPRPEVTSYGVVVEVADQPNPPKRSIILVSLHSGDLTLLRSSDGGFTTMQGQSFAERFQFMGEVCWQSWGFHGR